MTHIEDSLSLLVEAREVKGKPLAAHDKSLIVRRWLREPLLHFLIAGALIFVLGKRFDPSRGSGPHSNQIRVSAAETQRLSDVFTRQSGHPPDPAQMKSLIDDYVRDEVFYRDALSSNLDKDDTIIRRRLVEKMEFLSQELAAAPPSEEDVVDYFQKNRKRFRIPEQVAFSHIYFSTAKRGSRTESDARAALAILLSKNERQVQLSDLGDSFMLQNEYPLQTQQQIGELFGKDFAEQLSRLNSGDWAGPIRSGYGFHLVLISQKVPARIPDLAEVRSQVLTAFQNYRLQNASTAFYERLRKHYSVVIDSPSISNAETTKSVPVHSAVQGAVRPDVD
jgi:peptidyl-prolyl cis-trans isomerase C